MAYTVRPELVRRFSTLYRVDAIEALRALIAAWRDECFSTLYRVDAIEARLRQQHLPDVRRFQYPLSGRCY